jgi:predicted XRE-type DNA-binding protein
MTGNEFKIARKQCLKVSQSKLSELMKTPKRTIQDFEAKGDDQIRGVYEVCIYLLMHITKNADQQKKVAQAMDLLSGITSGPAA